MNFKEAKRLILSIGWTLNRVKGSHYIFRLDDDEKNEFILSQHRGDMKQYVIRKLRQMKDEYDAKPKEVITEEIIIPVVTEESSIISTHW